jgi:hypothetical protein
MVSYSRLMILFIITSTVLMLRMCNGQMLSVLKEAHPVCTTQVCCREHYLRGVIIFDWCIIDVDVDPSGLGCIVEARCQGDTPVCDASLRTCLKYGNSIARVTDSDMYLSVVSDSIVGNENCTIASDCKPILFCDSALICMITNGVGKCASQFPVVPICKINETCNNAQKSCIAPSNLSLSCNNICNGTTYNELTSICDTNASLALSCPTSQICDPSVGCVNCTSNTALLRCDDNNACTKDTCTNNVCINQPSCPNGTVCAMSVLTCQPLCNITACSQCDGNNCNYTTNTCMYNNSAPSVCKQNEQCDRIFGSCGPIQCMSDADCVDNGVFCDGLTKCNIITGICYVAAQCTGPHDVCLEDLRKCNHICSVDTDCAFPKSSFCDNYRPCDRANDFCLISRPRCNPVNETCDPFNLVCIAGGQDATPTHNPALSLNNGYTVAKWVILLWLFTFIGVVLCIAVCYNARYRKRNRRIT